MHRDELAGHNMCNIIQGHLLDQERPLYLQPVYADGTLVWAQNKGKNNVKDQDLPDESENASQSPTKHALINLEEDTSPTKIIRLG
jgi:hypothetical protein